jgi:ketosteroid isomerase-like protein
MSKENAAVVRRLYEGWRRGDFAVEMDVYDPAVVLEIEYGVDRSTATGIDDMRQLWREHLTLWELWSTGPIEELIEQGDQVVVAHSLQASSKRGLSLVSAKAGAAFTFRDGRVVRIVATDSREKALGAAGLTE